MALHFTREEISARLSRLQAAMKKKRRDALFLFAQESPYWLTGSSPA
jgi:Xaa-Pro dipeptidase